MPYFALNRQFSIPVIKELLEKKLIWILGTLSYLQDLHRWISILPTS